jgi:hypothetical protein
MQEQRIGKDVSGELGRDVERVGAYDPDRVNRRLGVTEPIHGVAQIQMTKFEAVVVSGWYGLELNQQA